MRELTYRKGFIKLWRLGDLNFRKQKAYKGIAPANNGIWAFPYPYYEAFFTHHKYLEAMPKKIFEDAEGDADSKWIHDVGKKVVRMTEFWYQGEIYTRLFNDGASSFEWNKVSAEELHRLVRKIRGDDFVEWIDGEKHHGKSSSDHLELFIPKGRGTIRSGKLPR